MRARHFFSRSGCFILVVMVSALTMCVSAQNVTSGITGVVTDPSGAVIAGADVQARNVDTGLTFPAKTNHNGIYNLASLPPGKYTLTIAEAGYVKSAVSQFSIESGQVVRYNVAMTLGSSTEVTVSSAPPLLDTQDSTLTTTYDAKQIENLPLVADNVMTMGLLVAGVVQTNPSLFDNIYHAGSFSNASFNVNGNREQQNNFTVDGLDINDAIDNWMAYTPSKDSLQEYQMITGNNTAEYGNANGGQVVMTTKSGTNQFHGSAFFQGQNTLMNANTWAQKHHATITPRQSQNRAYFGGTLGGPVLHDHLFFFIDYRGVRQHLTTTTLSVQPDPAKGGIAADDMTGQYGLAGTGTAYDPTLKKAVPVTNPAAKYLLSHPEIFPLCNLYAPGQAVGTGCTSQGGENFQGFTTTEANINQGDVKLDWRLTDHDIVSGRFTQVDNRTDTSRVTLPVNTPTSGDYPYHGFVINWSHTVGNIVNDARIGYSRTRYINFPVDITGLIGTHGLSDLGIPSPAQVYPGVPQVLFSGTGGASSSFGPTNGGRASRSVVNAFTYGDKVQWLLGKNSLKFGAQAIRYQENRFYSGNYGPDGYWIYNGNNTNAALSTGSSYADFLEDEAASFTVGASNGEWGQRQWRPAVYFQDDIRATADLTINAGIRWEYDQPMYEVNNKESTINPATGAISFAGQNGASRALYKSYRLGFMPRFGFAYSPAELRGRFVIRGGYAITNFMEGLGANQRMTQNPFFIYAASGTASGSTPERMAVGYPIQTLVTPSNFVSNLIAFQSDLKPGLVQQFNLTTEEQLTHSLALRLGYVGQVGHHLAALLSLNQAPCSTIALYAGMTPCNSPLATILPAIAAHQIQYTSSQGYMNYNAAQLTLRQQTTKDLFFLFNYTYSKAMTDNSGYYGSGAVIGSTYAYPQDSNNLAGDYGPSYFDTPHLISFAVTYTLPIGHGQMIGSHMHGWLNSLMGGWNVGMTGQYHTGFPEAIYSTTYYKVNQASTSVSRAMQYRPLKIKNRSYDHWLGTDPSAKAALNSAAPHALVPSPATATVGASKNNIYTTNDNGTSAFGEELSTGFGNSSMGVVRNPGYHNFDASASKSFALPKGMALAFRTDAFNVFNGVSWAGFNNNISNSTYGSISSTGTITTERHLKIGLNLTF